MVLQWRRLATLFHRHRNRMGEQDLFAAALLLCTPRDWQRQAQSQAMDLDDPTKRDEAERYRLCAEVIERQSQAIATLASMARDIAAYAERTGDAALATYVKSALANCKGPRP